MHRRDENHPLADTGLANGISDVVRDADELAAARGVEGAVDGVGGQAGDRGIEPRAMVLETIMLPLHQSPSAAGNRSLVPSEPYTNICSHMAHGGVSHTEVSSLFGQGLSD